MSASQYLHLSSNFGNVSNSASFQANNVEVEETVLVRLHDIHHACGSQNNITVPHEFNPLAARPDPCHRRIIQPSLRRLFTDHLSTAAHTDRKPSSSLTADHHGVINGIDS